MVTVAVIDRTGTARGGLGTRLAGEQRPSNEEPPMPRRRLVPFAAALLPLLAAPAMAEDRFDIGARLDLPHADGEPANDIPGYGLFGHYRWDDRWALGFALDVAEYDFEEPARLLGITQDPAVDVVDAKADGTTLSAWFERTLGEPGSKGHWYWGAGLGLASVDVPDARGPVAGGGTFDIETDAGTEVVVTLLGGRRFRFGDRWALDLTLHLDEHFAEWEVVDRVSGRTGTIDDYFTYGGNLGLAFRF
jgi:hypothetical protein